MCLSVFSRSIGRCLLASYMLVSTTQLHAQDKHERCSDDAMVVFDGSGSMAEMGYNGLNQPRIIDARIAVQNSMPQIAPFRKLGLIIYGPGREDACSNVDLRFSPIANAAPRMIADIENLSPAGKTPLTRAVRNAAETLNYQENSGVIVLVTDGKETCGGTPCQLAAELAASSSRLTVHVIGFKVRDDFFQWSSQGTDAVENAPTVARCLADRTGGKYISTESADELVSALQETLSCPLIGRVRTQGSQVLPG